MSAPRPAEADRPPRGSSKVAQPYFLESRNTTAQHADAPSGRGFITLLQAFRATGGTAPGNVVSRLLKEPQFGHAVSLAKLVVAGQVFGFEWRHGLWLPMFQFDPGVLSPRFDVQRVRAELPSLPSGWAVASWFARPNGRLEGRSPVDALERDPQAVMWAARAHRWADERTQAALQPAREVAVPV